MRLKKGDCKLQGLGVKHEIVVQHKLVTLGEGLNGKNIWCGIKLFTQDKNITYVTYIFFLETNYMSHISLQSRNEDLEMSVKGNEGSVIKEVGIIN